MNLSSTLLSPSTQDDEVADLIGDYLRSCEDESSNLWVTVDTIT